MSDEFLGVSAVVLLAILIFSELVNRFQKSKDIYGSIYARIPFANWRGSVSSAFG